MELKNYIEEIENFPIEGISFKDITSLLKDAEAFKYVVDQMAGFAKSVGAEVIVGPEARGFVVGCPVAYKIGIGFVPARKPQKLPRNFITKDYGLEYGENQISIHIDDIKKGQKVVITDDLLATGGTIEACIDLIEQLGGVVVGIATVIELTDLKARDKFKDYKIFELVQY